MSKYGGVGMENKILHILIDSSTKSGRTKYGPSTVCWSIFRNEIKGMPCRVGIIYGEEEGPNKFFYVGVIKALEDCFLIKCKNHEIKVYGDLKLVIDQLNGGNIRTLKRYKDQVVAIEEKLLNKKIQRISYHYKNDDDKIYYKVDQCAKKFHEFLNKEFKP
jgi:ribonuclease HI